MRMAERAIKRERERERMGERAHGLAEEMD